uniref:Uncharacterized protein n=1 Tax=Solanum lycopersicum TaxID=4081 RepID=A0A3Q7GWT2_SOLLC
GKPKSILWFFGFPAFERLHQSIAAAVAAIWVLHRRNWSFSPASSPSLSLGERKNQSQDSLKCKVQDFKSKE